MKIGKKIRQIRNSQNKTLKEIADAADISISYLSDIEHEKKNPSINTLFKIADALEVHINNLTDEVQLYDNNSKENDINIIGNLFPCILKCIKDASKTNPDINKIVESLGLRKKFLALPNIITSVTFNAKNDNIHTKLNDGSSIDFVFSDKSTLKIISYSLKENANENLNKDTDVIQEAPIAYNTHITDVKEAMNVILAQPGLMLNGEILSDDSKIALANAINMGLAYATQMQQKEKEKNNNK